MAMIMHWHRMRLSFGPICQYNRYHGYLGATFLADQRYWHFQLQ
jgi:hypothetical protein